MLWVPAMDHATLLSSTTSVVAKIELNKIVPSRKLFREYSVYFSLRNLRPHDAELFPGVLDEILLRHKLTLSDCHLWNVWNPAILDSPTVRKETMHNAIHKLHHHHSRSRVEALMVGGPSGSRVINSCCVKKSLSIP